MLLPRCYLIQDFRMHKKNAVSSTIAWSMTSCLCSYVLWWGSGQCQQWVLMGHPACLFLGLLPFSEWSPSVWWYFWHVLVRFQKAQEARIVAFALIIHTYRPGAETQVSAKLLPPFRSIAPMTCLCRDGGDGGSESGVYSGSWLTGFTNWSHKSPFLPYATTGGDVLLSMWMPKL